MKIKKLYLTNREGLEALMGFAERNPTMNTDDILQRAVRKGWLELVDDKETGREEAERLARLHQEGLVRPVLRRAAHLDTVQEGRAGGHA